MYDDFDQFHSEPDADEPQAVATPQDRNALAVQMLRHIHESVGHIIELLDSGNDAAARAGMLGLISGKQRLAQTTSDLSGCEIFEGVFDGCGMIRSDGSRHDVPENYASKSRLVEGDVLKLTIQQDGRHLYKQIGPVERRRSTGQLDQDPSTGRYIVITQEGVYNVLTASVTFFKGVPGDEVVIVLPRAEGAKWAAVETIK